MSPAELAILQLAQTRAAFEALSRRIGDALGACEAQQLRETSNNSADHLKDAYAITRESSEFGGTDFYFDNHDGDAGEYLSGICPHCRAAHDAIQDRKLARKQYGIAKRRVSLMGSTMLKAEAKKVTPC